MAVDFNVINVFNENIALSYDQSKSSGYFSLSEDAVCASGDPVCATNRLTSGGVLTQYAAAEAAFTGGTARARSITFNKPISFQEPRSIRFGFRVLF